MMKKVISKSKNVKKVRILFDGSDAQTIIDKVKQTRWGHQLDPKVISNRKVRFLVPPDVVKKAKRFAKRSTEVEFLFIESTEKTDAPMVIVGAQHAIREQERAKAAPGKTPLGLWPSELVELSKSRK